MKAFTINDRSIKDCLKVLSARSNKTFTESLHPGIEHILGIRMGDLRQLARDIAKNDWRSYLKSADGYYMEERTLQGLVLSYVYCEDVNEYLCYVDAFVKVINSWSVCDSFAFAGGQKFVTEHRKEIWLVLTRYMLSTHEYVARFGVVMSMKYYLNAEHLPLLFAQYAKIAHNGYYVRMAIAWALSVCFVKFPTQTIGFLKTESLDDFTHRKTIQKIRESYRVSAEQKRLILSLKRDPLP